MARAAENCGRTMHAVANVLLSAWFGHAECLLLLLLTADDDADPARLLVFECACACA